MTNERGAGSGAVWWGLAAIGASTLGCAGALTGPAEITIGHDPDLWVSVSRRCEPMPGLRGAVGGVPMTLVEAGRHDPAAAGQICVPPTLVLPARDAASLPEGTVEVVLTEGSSRWVVEIESARAPRLGAERDGDGFRLRPTPATLRPPGPDAWIRWFGSPGEGCVARVDVRPDPADGWRVSPPPTLCPGEARISVDDRARQRPVRCPDGWTCRQKSGALSTNVRVP